MQKKKIEAKNRWSFCLLHNTSDKMPIKSIEFGFFSPKMIKEMAAIKIEKAELYDPDGYPIDGGLSDTSWCC